MLKVVNIMTGEVELVHDFQAPPPLPLTAEDYAAAAQTHIDVIAQSKGYSDGVSLASYTTSTIPSWKAEADAFVAWRDLVWVTSYTLLAEVTNGQRPTPTIEQFISELPIIEWPI